MLPAPGLGVCITNEASLLSAPDFNCDIDSQGCDVEFWSAPENLIAWPAVFQPDTLFVDVFNIDSFPGANLFEVLNMNGEGELESMAAETIAAMLNAAHQAVNYPLTQNEIPVLYREGVLGNISMDRITNEVLGWFNGVGCQ